MTVDPAGAGGGAGARSVRPLPEPPSPRGPVMPSRRADPSASPTTRRPTRREARRFRAVFAITLCVGAAGALLLGGAPDEARLDAPPVLAAAAAAAPEAPSPITRVATPRGAPESRAAATEQTLARRLGDLLAALRAEPAARKERWLHSKATLMGSGCLERLLRIGGGEEMTRLVIDRLRDERDPLTQAVMLRFLGLRARDPDALAALTEATRSLLLDERRAVHAQLAVDGVICLMGHQGVPPHATLEFLTRASSDPVVLRDAWLALASPTFAFADIDALLDRGLTDASPDVRFGAAEALRMHARRGALDAASFVERFAPLAVSDPNPRNRVLFMETLARCGGEAARGIMVGIATDRSLPAEFREMAAQNLAMHVDPARAERLVDALRRDGDSASMALAVRTLEALAGRASVDGLKEILATATDPGVREDALRALATKQGVGPEVFEEAARADDPELRRLACRRLLATDPASLPPERAAAHAHLLRERSLRDDDPHVRSDALLGVLLGGEEDAVSYTRERMLLDGDREVRSTAAASLYLLGLLRDDADLRRSSRAVLDRDGGWMRETLVSELGTLESWTPDELTSTWRRRLDLWSLARGTVAPGASDPFGGKMRFLERLLALAEGGAS